MQYVAKICKSQVPWADCGKTEHRCDRLVVGVFSFMTCTAPVGIRRREGGITALIQVGCLRCVGGDMIKKQNKTCQLTPGSSGRFPSTNSHAKRWSWRAPHHRPCRLIKMIRDRCGGMDTRPRSSVLQPYKVTAAKEARFAGSKL